MARTDSGDSLSNSEAYFVAHKDRPETDNYLALELSLEGDSPMLNTTPSIAYEGTNPSVDIAALNLPNDGSAYTLVKTPPGNTLDEVVKVMTVLPQIQQALKAQSIFGKVFGLMAIAGELGAIQ